MAETKKLQVFLCHASADKPKVRELHRYLRRRGIAPWLDAEDLLPGQDWQVEIPKALLASDVIIVCLSKNSVTKEGYVQKEIGFALDKAQEKLTGAIFIIPAKLEECDVPDRLARFHWVDLHIDGGNSRLMRALKVRAEQLARTRVEVPKADETGPILTSNPLVSDERDVAVLDIIAGDNNVVQMPANPKAQDEAAKQEKQAENERQVQEKAEVQRVAEEANAKRIADEKAAQEYESVITAKKIARQKEQDRIRDQAATERVAKQKAERDQQAKLVRAQIWRRIRIPALLLGSLLIVFFSFSLWRFIIPAIPTPIPTKTLAQTTNTRQPATKTQLPTKIPITPTSSTVPIIEPTLTPVPLIIGGGTGKIFFCDPDGNFFSINSNGTSQALISSHFKDLEDGHYDCQDFTISGDGKKIFFAWGGRLTSLDLASLVFTNLQVPYGHYTPDWSHNGEYVVTNSTATNSENIWLINMQTLGLRRLTNENEAQSCPRWSPDDKYVAFIGNKFIWKVRFSGDDKTKIVSYRGRDGYAEWACPSWSPDGLWIAYSDGTGITLVKSDGSQEKRKIVEQNAATNPDFSPNGKYVVYSTNAGLYTVNIDTKEINRVVSMFFPSTWYGKAEWQP